ncbi:MAG: hypothetical protein KBS77_07740 [Bacteroidales bacterium]|nr:hypothetical protein [Candidatus Colicola faecequi]
MLEKTANGRERLTYMRNLTEAEIESESRKLARLCKERNDLEQEKADMNREYADKIKSVKASIDGHAKMLNDGHKEEIGICYKFVNIDAREVGFYNAAGELVRSRELLDQDLQMDMFNNNGTAGPVAALPKSENDYEEAVIVSEEEDEEDPDEPELPWNND